MVFNTLSQHKFEFFIPAVAIASSFVNPFKETPKTSTKFFFNNFSTIAGYEPFVSKNTIP